MYRIIEASSNKGNVVFDPFCGCATTCVASEKLGRQWVGIDVSIEAYKQVKKRLAKEITPEYTRPRKESSFTKRGSNVCIVSYLILGLGSNFV